jgi:hypothetical protein
MRAPSSLSSNAASPSRSIASAASRRRLGEHRLQRAKELQPEARQARPPLEQRRPRHRRQRRRAARQHQRPPHLRRRHRRRRQRLGQLTDFGFVSSYGISMAGDTLRLIYWLIPWTVWLFYTRPRRSADHDRWLAVRSRLLVMHAPGLLLSLITIVSVISKGLTGLAVYGVGCSLLALGYLGIADRRGTGPGAGEVGENLVAPPSIG